MVIQRLFLMVVSTILLISCTTTINSDVVVFHDWNASISTKTFIFSRNKAQENNAEYRYYENLIRAQLIRLGFIEVPTISSAVFKTTINYRSQIHNSRGLRAVPLNTYSLGYAPFYNSNWPYEPLHQLNDGPFWYSFPSVVYQEVNVPLYQHQLQVIISRVIDNKQLYDVTVEQIGNNRSLATMMPYMARSAFSEFPGRSGELRRISMQANK